MQFLLLYAGESVLTHSRLNYNAGTSELKKMPNIVHLNADIAYLYMFTYLTHINLAYFLWDICKQCRARSAAQNAASDQDLHYLLTGCSIKICPFSTMHDFCRLSLVCCLCNLVVFIANTMD